jgi:hypothetical protein
MTVPFMAGTNWHFAHTRQSLVNKNPPENSQPAIISKNPLALDSRDRRQSSGGRSTPPGDKSLTDGRRSVGKGSRKQLPPQ